MTIQAYLHRIVAEVQAAGDLRSRPVFDLRRQGYSYSCVAEWFLRHGRLMSRDGEIWSRIERAFIRRVLDRTRPKAGQCFSNAQRAVLAALILPGSLRQHELQYCEGYSQLPGQHAPFAHGWCLLNGKIWDPTLDALHAAPAGYFGLAFPTVEVMRRVFHRRSFGPLVNDWRAGWPLLQRPWVLPFPVLEPQVASARSHPA